MGCGFIDRLVVSQARSEGGRREGSFARQSAFMI